VGKENLAEFKIYEDTGIDNIRHFSFVFGLAKGQIIVESKAMIELDIDHEGNEILHITDPRNALDNVLVLTNLDDCGTNCGRNTDGKYLHVKIYHTFMEPLDFDIVASNVWDNKRNAWQNYYNDGIEVLGKSLNSPREHTGIYQGHTYRLIETGMNTAIDEYGYSWTFQYDTWNKDYIKQQRIHDGHTDVFTRTHSDFALYKQAEIDKAFVTLQKICPECVQSEYPVFTDYSGSIERSQVFSSWTPPGAST